MRILVLAVLTLAVLTMASGSSSPEPDGNPAEHSREDSQGGQTSITNAVKTFVAVKVDGAGRVVNSTTVRAKDPIIGEQLATALAPTMDKIEVIYSDSSAALRAFAKGTVTEETLKYYMARTSRIIC
ncbi:hypothetical protein MTO96_029030 [Rhipicephalus appendiculatus]